MSFFGGAVVGVVAGLAAGILLARSRAGPSSRRASGDGAPGRSSSGSGRVAIVMATVAIVVSGVALVRSGHTDHTSTTDTATTTTGAPNGSNTSPSTTTPGGAAGAPSTTTTLFVGATVSVPNVVEMTKDAAVATLGNVGLKATVETLPLANVPPGFVISQSPLPSAQVTAGSPVSLVVSSAS
jgi:hypothetical protein